MGYNELIKNFDVIRDYMRDFYVYGWGSRDEYDKKSSRTYDDAKRRIENWLGEYMKYQWDSNGKRVFISVDTRNTVHNPLYKALKAKSFTNGDITLFFIIFDILHEPSVYFPLSEILDKIDKEYLSHFEETKIFDGSTVRKKLNEYVSMGLLKTKKQGKILYYFRAENISFNNTDVLHFFSEIMPCGAFGAFLLDKQEEYKDIFTFKHHYINSALDSEIVYSLFSAMHEKREIEIKKITRKGNKRILRIVPLKLFISVQNGRQYLMAYKRRNKRISSYRIDYIFDVKPLEKAEDFDFLRNKLNGMQPFLWGVSTQGKNVRRETVEFTVYFQNDEQHIYDRLQREKRCGTVEKIDDSHARFYAEVYDTNEMLTWIRSFTGRITYVNFSDKEIESQLKADIEAMYRMYGVSE